jgi:antitoxin component YwqK of YwqJK toxin-antitoxin module
MKRFLGFLICLSVLAGLMSFQDIPMERKVMRKHANGKEHVVLFFDKETGDLLKEEVFYADGKLNWTGNYKRNVENGLWQFYYPNGKLKTSETYSNGKENGISTHYSESGKKIKEETWKNGKLIKEVKF